MIRLNGWKARIVTAMGEGGGPWGGRGSGGGEGGGSDGGGPRNPWSPRPGGGNGGKGPGGGRGPSALDELIRRGREGFGGGFPSTPGGRSIWPIILLIFIALWIGLTSVHRIGPQERGVVLRLGSYAGVMGPGINFSLPAPFSTVEKVDVEEIRTVDIGSVGTQNANLVLTGDQNIIDLAYSVRWNISSPQLFLLQLKEPEDSIREVAESAMRSVVASVSLEDALGAGRSEIEKQVELRMQEILNTYRSGIRIQGVAIKQADPPTAVNDAFKEVSAAQQAAQTDLNQARAYAQQLTARAQGEAAAFDKVYEQYRLAPDVTRRRMYYETMEEVLANTDKTVVETGNVTPYLPLPEIKKRAEQAATTTEGATQ